MEYEELDPREAQKIADGIMEIVPYNINIMNQKGYIIASGDKQRLNTLHLGAVMALSTSQPHIVYNDTLTERRGVNLPIVDGGNTVGVIGISGDCEEVMPIAKIVVLTARLMLENEKYRKVSLMKEERKRDFLFEWASLERESYPQSFINRGKTLQIDVTLPSVAVLLMKEQPKEKKYPDEGYSGLRSHVKLQRNEYIIREWMQDTLVVLQADAGLERRIDEILEESAEIASAYVGEKNAPLYLSIRRAQQVKNYALSMNLKTPSLHYEDIAVDLTMLSAEQTSEEKKLRKIMREYDVSGELAETIYVYMNNTQNIGEICSKLHIHRNTLNYRLNKIQDVTGKNPRLAKDLLLLYVSVLRQNME